MKNLEKEIRAYALKNALEFGKADAGKILPKLFQHGLDKKDISSIMPTVSQIVKEINSLSKEKQEKGFLEIRSLIPEKEEKEKTLPEIDVSNLKTVVTRIAPEPSKYLHLGHALSFLLNYTYAKKYKGKCYIRFEDTNPEKVSQEFVDSMLEEFKNYLDIKPDGIRYISDDMQLLYDYAEQLIKINKAYMCFCDRDAMQKNRHEGIECEHRVFPVKKNLEEWKNFLKGKYLKGEATLRIKGDMKSQNHVMRDSVIFRAIDAPHYRHKKKYKVWPMYDFYNAVEDSIMGITLILRSNEFDLRVELQDYIKDLLKLQKQKIVQYGRFNVVDFTTQGREIRQLIDSGELLGWDDPRLITIKALRRRGIQKEAIEELLNQVGLVKHPVNLEFEMLAAINRKIIDPTALRYSFVDNPVQLKIKNAPKIKTINVPVHPDKKETRKIKISDIFISKEDFEKYKGQEIRLQHLYNIRINSDASYDSRANKSRASQRSNLKNKSARPIATQKINSVEAEFTSTENKNIQKINWVSDGVPTKVLMPDAKWRDGIAESAIKTLKNNKVVQFERFGFARFDSKRGKNYQFWFSHK